MDDCISRQATVKRLCKVADFMNEKRSGSGSPYIMAALFIQDNKDEFPPVTPKQQICDDCISRQAVDELSKELVHTTRDKADFLCNFWEGLQKLPSVTPKEKTGRWISFGIQGEIDGQIVKAFVCSECGAISVFRLVDGEIVNGDLCPNCGCQMVKPQESEGKE